MLNNNLFLMGVALTNYEIDGKTATFKIEITKQSSGDTYPLELKAYTNSKSIRFDEKIKGKLVAVLGFVGSDYKLNATNVMSFAIGSAASAPIIEKAAAVLTAQELENQNIEITDDDLPF